MPVAVSTEQLMGINKRYQQKNSRMLVSGGSCLASVHAKEENEDKEGKSELRKFENASKRCHLRWGTCACRIEFSRWDRPNSGPKCIFSQILSQKGGFSSKILPHRHPECLVFFLAISRLFRPAYFSDGVALAHRIQEQYHEWRSRKDAMIHLFWQSGRCYNLCLYNNVC